MTNHFEFATINEIYAIMSGVSSDEIATIDTVDPSTGEILWEEGTRADSCRYHPVYIARVTEKSKFEDRLYSDPEGLLNHLIEAFVNDCEPCDIDPETALDVADSFLCSLPYHTDIETFLDEINFDRDCDDEMTRDDIRNVIAEKLTANN